MEGGSRIKHNPLRRAALSVLLLFCLFLTGCFEALSVDDQSYPVVIGFDRGKERRFCISMQIPELQSSDSSSQKTGITLISAEGDDLFSVKSIIDSSVPWVINFSHAEYLVISEELAKSSDMEELLTDVPRFLELRQSAVLIIAKESAQRFLEGLYTSGGTNPGRVLSDLMLEPDLTGRFPHSRMEEYNEALFTDCYDAAIALGAFNDSVSIQSKDEKEGDANAQNTEDIPAGDTPRAGGLASELAGCALFKDGRMVGELTARQTQFLQMGRGTFKKGAITLHSIPNAQALSLQLTQTAPPNVSLDLSAVPVTAAATLHLMAEPYEGITPQGQALNLYDPSDSAVLSAQIIRHLTDGLEETEALLRQFGTDCWGLGCRAVRSFALTSAWEAYRWRDVFPTVDISWQIDLKLSRPQTEFYSDAKP